MENIRAWIVQRVYTVSMGLTRYATGARRFGVVAPGDASKLGPWGIYGEAIGNPKFYMGTNPNDSEFLQADAEFAAAHEDLLRELAKH